MRLVGFLPVALGILAAPLSLPAQEAARGKIIRRISIEGLRRTPESQLLSRLNIRLGEVYDPTQVSRETGRLYSLGQFRLVKGPFVLEFEDGVAIRFVVEEKPTVLQLEFPGRKNLDESYLLREPPAMRSREGELYNAYWIRQDANAIRQKYLEDGYRFVQVDPQVTETEAGVYVRFVISEGTRVRVREVSFVGNRSIPSGTLLGLMETREKDFWFFGLIRSGFFDPSALSRDLGLLKNYYRRFGFHDVKIGVESIELDESKERLRVTVRVEEGPQFSFRGYRFSGNGVFSDQALRALCSSAVNKPFNAESMERDRQDIQDYYGDRAYIFAEVEPSFEYPTEGADVYVRFRIREGNETYIEHVKIRGNVKTQDRVIRRELEFHPGERVDRSKLVKSRSNLARLRIFNDIRYSYEDGSAPSYKDLVVEIEEADTGQLIVGVGLTSGFGFLGNFAVTKRNFDLTDLPSSIYEIPDRFTGAGQTLNLVAQPGTRRSFYRLTFVEPYLFDTRNALTLSASALDFLREDWTEKRATFAPSIAHAFNFDRDFVVSLGARLEEVEVTDIEEGAPADAFAAEGFTSVVALNTTLSYDKVLYEPLEGPYDGHEERIFYEYGGGILGGEVDFHKLQVENSFYFPLYTHEAQNLHHVIAFLNRFGVIEPHDSDESIPIFERFFLGGPFTVRGFDYRGLGPHENNSPIGGTAQLYGTFEYSFPLFQKILRGVVFVDYGNLARTLDEFNFNEMRFAAGGGVRINFPFFGAPIPIGLYLGYPIKKEPQDEERLFLFTIGAPF